MATQYAFGQIVTSGLVLALNAADPNSYPGSGTTWRDMSGNGNTGTLTNGPTFNSANGGSIVFDGTDDYVDCGNKSIFDFTTNFTIGAWINRNTTQNSVDSGIIGKINQSDGYLGYLLLYNANTVDLYIRGATRVNSSTTILANTWYYVVGTYNGTTAAFYINGVLDSSANVSISAVATAANFEIGRYNAGPFGNRGFTGRISIASAYNRALSASEVLQNYNATKSRFNLT